MRLRQRVSGILRDNYLMTKRIIRSPREFLEGIKDEKGIRKPFNFMTIFTFIVFIFLTYYYLDQLNRLFRYMAGLVGTPEIYLPMTLKVYIMAYASFIVAFLTIAFLRYYIVHLFVRLFKGRFSYGQTYKALTYSLAPEYISTPFFVLLVALLPILYLHRTPALFIVFACLLIPYLIVFFYTIYLRILALSLLQEISMLKAAASIYILGFICQSLVMLILEMLVLLPIFLSSR